MRLSIKLLLGSLSIFLTLHTASPMIAGAQEEYPIYCDLMDDDDCDLFLSAAAAMTEVRSATSDLTFQFEMTGIPEIPFENLTLEVTQDSAFALTDEANESMEKMVALMQGDLAAMQANSTAFGEAYVGLISGLTVDSDLTVTVSEDMIQLIEMIAEEEGNPIPFDLATEFRLRTRIVDNAAYFNISDIAAFMPFIAAVGDIWLGFEYGEFLKFMVEMDVFADGFTDMSQQEWEQMRPFITTSASSGRGPMASMLATLPIGAEIAPFLLVERIEDGEIDGHAVANFRTTIDYITLLEEPGIQKILVDAMYEQGVIGPNASAQEIDDMLFLASNFGPPLLDTLGLQVVESIDLESALMLRSEVMLDWDVAQLRPLLEMAGEMDTSDMEDLPVITMFGRTNYTNHNEPVVVDKPDTALIFKFDDLIAIIEAEIAAEEQALVEEAPAPVIVAGELTPISSDAEALYLDAVAYMNDGDHLAAIPYLDDAIQLDPENAEYYAQRGRAHYFLAKYETALLDFQSAIDIKPSAVSLNGRGASTRELGDLESAIADFEAAIELEPSYPQAHYNLAYAYSTLGDYEQAVASYTDAIDVHPEYVDAYKDRGVAYYELGDYEAALRDYEAALEIDPTFAKAYIDRGNVYLAYEQYSDAEESYTTAIELDATDPIAYNNRGWSRHLQNGYDGALADYSSAIELAPRYVTAYYNRADLYRTLTEYELAIQDYDTILSIDPESGWAHYDRGLSYYDLSNYEVAISDFDAYLEFDPTNQFAYFYRGYSHYALGNTEQEIADYTAAIEIDPEYDIAYYFRALTYIDAGENAAALEDLNEAVRLRPDDIDFLNERGLLYIDEGETALGIADFDRIIELAPDDSTGYINRSYAHHLEEEYELALEYAGAAIEVDPENPIAWGNRADALGRLGDIEQALADFEKALELDPDHAAAYRDRGDLFERLERLPEAIADLTRYLELEPDAEDREEVEDKIAAME